MTFNQAQQYLFSLHNISRLESSNDPRHAGIYLKRVRFFLDLIGNPELHIPQFVHVTGTSGKGSVCRFLGSIFSSSGVRTGVLTSPHAHKITERWAIDGVPMPDKEFISLITWLKPILDEYIRKAPYEGLSYVELTTIIGLHYFSLKRVSMAIIEVGCGGKFDSTNIIPHKAAAIITNIGRDHLNIWKNKTAITKEKAGIITPTTRVYSAEKQKKFKKIILEEAKKQRANSVTFVSPTTYTILKRNEFYSIFEMDGHHYRINTVGNHQVENAALAVTVSRDLGVREASIVKGLKTATQPTRMESISRYPRIILDSAHNRDKIRATVVAMNSTYSGKKIHVLLGLSADKELQPIISELITLKPIIVYCTRQTMNPFRGVMNPQKIATCIQRLSPHTMTNIYLDPVEALARARAQMKSRDILLITGSLFLAGELRPYLTKKRRKDTV